MLGFYSLNEQPLNSLPAANQGFDPFQFTFASLLTEIALPNPYPLFAYQMMHPGVEYFENGWNGWKYWLVYTPLPSGDYSKENPCIAVSNDGQTWVAPDGVTNPLVTQFGGGGQFNADTDLFYDSHSDQLCIIWKAQSVSDPGGERCYTQMITSSDGTNWSSIYTVTDDLQSERLPATASLYYNDDLSRYEIVAINASSSPANPDYDLFVSDTLTGLYTVERQISIPADTGRHWWNLYIKRLPDGSYVGMGQDADNAGMTGAGSVFWLKSDDGLTYERQLALESEGLYRCAFTLTPDNGVYKVFIAGVISGTSIRVGDLRFGQTYDPIGESTYASDSFNRANSASVGNPETGLPLIRSDAAYSIQSNQLAVSGSGAIVWDAGQTTAVVSLDVADMGADGDLWVVGRYVDANNFIRIGFNGVYARYQSVIAGVASNLVFAGSVVPFLENGDKITVEFNTDYVAVSCGGRPFFHHPTSDSFGGQGFGIDTTRNGLILDNLSIQERQAPPPIVVQVGTAAGSGQAQSVTPITPVQVDVGTVTGSGQAQSVNPINGASGIAFTLYRNANASNRLNGAYPNGGEPAAGGGGGAVDWDAVYDAWIASQTGAGATTYYVDPVSGNNSNDGLTEGTGFADPTAAYAVMSGGDVIEILDGVITDNDLFAFNDYEHSIPSGISRTNRTIIRAKNPFGVRIRFTTGNRNSNYEAIRLNASNFMLIDGFIIEWLNEGGDPQYVCTSNQNENILTRTIIKRDEHGSWGGYASWTGSYSLLQDVHGVGGARYGFQVGGGTTDPAEKMIARRCVARVDFSDATLPMAPFAHYGNNSGTASRETEFQNCIPIDGPYVDVSPGNSENFDYTWGGFYHAKNAYNIRHRGCMVINQGGRAGMWTTDNGSDLATVIEHCVVAGENPVKYGTRSGFRANSYGSADYLTGVDIDGSDLGNGLTAANAYFSDVAPASIFNAPGGADVRYAFGAFGSVWGEAGFDAVTTDQLWPFPYEDKIKEVFSEQLDSPSGYDPVTNDSTRGFCSGVQTLSEYIASYSSGDPATVLAGLY